MQGDDDLTVWLKALDGQWEVCGADRLRGVYPEAFQASANRRGSDTCRFVLRRDPGAIHPDLSAFTPCRVFVAGVKVWSGEIKETPTDDGDDPQISVEGRGTQYPGLDDDKYERVYVTTKLAEWKDARSFLAESLANYTQQGQVSQDQGIVLGWPKGSTLPAISPRVGIGLDLGPDSTAKRIVVEWESSNPGANFSLTCRGNDVESEFAAAGDVAFSVTVNTAGTTSRGTFATPRRFIHLYLLWSTTTPLAADVWLRITSIRVFRDTAYESGDVSILKADTVFKDALNSAAFVLSSDQSLIQAGTFSLPEFALDGAKTPGEVGDAVNAYEGNVLMVDVDDRVVFKPKPTAPQFEIGEWSGADFKDASANSGENIYNRVRVEAEGPDGAKLRVDRAAGGGAMDVGAVAQPANPSADVNTANWSSLGGPALVRDTGVFDSSPASFRLDDGGIWGTADVTQQLRRGLHYRLRLAVRLAGANSQQRVEVRVLPSGGLSTTVPFASIGVKAADSTFIFSYASPIVIAEDVWVAVETDWIQPVDSANYFLWFVAGAASLGPIAYVDTIQVGRTRPTLVDRRDRQRTQVLPVSSAMTPGAMARVGDLWLQDHRTTPLKGDLQIVGQGGVRRVLGGQPVHPAHLLRYPNELVRLSHRIDPDTGGHGRKGEIAAVTYDHDARQALVSIDDQRDNLEKLLARYAAVVG